MTYKISLKVDAEWLEAIRKMTDVDYLEEGEVLEWLEVTEV